MKLLAIDTSSRACSAAVMDDGALLGESYLANGLTHSRTLSPLVDSLLTRLELSAEDFDLFAVSNGPGSFTGLRIGLSMVKGMAFAVNKPCVGVSTLLSLAYNLFPFKGEVCAVLDARASQVYAARFLLDGEKVTRLTEDAALTLEELSSTLSPGTILVGDGAKLVYNAFSDRELIVAPPDRLLQRASSVARAALLREPIPAWELAPCYLRRSQAEREREAAMHHKQDA